MGVPFQVDVNVVTHAEQVDALEKRLNALQSKGVDLKWNFFWGVVRCEEKFGLNY